MMLLPEKKRNDAEDRCVFIMLEEDKSFFLDIFQMTEPQDATVALHSVDFD